MAEQLHTERVDPDTRGQLLHDAALADLPDGAFVLRNGAPWVTRGDELLRWNAGGYVVRTARPGGQVALITPPSLVFVLRSGWTSALPLLHPSAD